MFRAEKLVWVGEPSHKFDEKFQSWPQWTTWDFKMQDGDKSWDGIMGEEEHAVYLAEVEILKKVDALKLSSGVRVLLDLIEKYGDEREEKGRHDIREEWAESNAGASV